LHPGSRPRDDLAGEEEAVVPDLEGIERSSEGAGHA
jgi:hypothetical protein